MIGRLLGNVIERGIDGCCVLDVAGVGYEVFVPLRSMGRLPAERATLHVHTHVREEALMLFGFETAADREASLLEAVVAPALRARNDERRQQGLRELEALAEAAQELAQLLFLRDLREFAAR